MKAQQKCEILVDLINEYSPVDLRNKGRKGIGFRMIYGYILFNWRNEGNILTSHISMEVAGKEIGRDHSTISFYKRESEYNLKYFNLFDLCDKIKKEFYTLISCGEYELIDSAKVLIKIEERLIQQRKDLSNKLRRVRYKLNYIGRESKNKVKEQDVKKYKTMNTFKAGKGKAVIEVDANGNKIQTFISVQEAANKLNLSYTMIRRVCCYDSAHHKGRFFVFESEFEGMFSLKAPKKQSR